uniref:Uncharacterized protein n=1 Tax=viral metagenome TaxID=1070528 RepID=A0A6C0FAH1_9ZZZZ|tara:strand:- start:107 stop:859 length:753 start_codon:yes stop_codon:yes gene_type:complete
MSKSQMSFISEVTKDIAAAEEKFLGPTYPYYKKIRSPRSLGMGSQGSMPQLARNISGLINYVEVLVTGQGKGSTTGRPLGNKFFLKTAGTCKDVSSKKVVPRYVYISNIPSGNIPIVSSALGTNFSSFKGLVPGSMSNLNALNPMGFIAAFGAGAQPPCRALSMETVDNNDNRGRATHFVADSDINQLDPCLWGNGRNPVSGKRCRETFAMLPTEPELKLPKDPIVQLYFAIIGIGIIYLIYRIFMMKRK